MTKRFTSAGAMLAMRAVTGDYFLALGKGQDTTGLLEEATVAGYARQPVTIVARRAIGTNAAAVSFGSFAAAAGRYTHAGLYTARVGGACIWVGPLETPVELVAGGSVTIAAGVLTLRIALVGTEVSAVIAPANTALPLIAGTARVGESLTASTGAWSGTAPLAYAFQWQRGTATIAGATAATYAVQPGDLGQTLRAVVTATNGAGAAQAVSGATAPVSAALIAPANTATPVITGTAQEGEVLTASTGTWSGTAPITYAFQWQRGATPIAGATVASYTVQNADVDRTLRVIVTAANIAGTMEAASASTGQVAAAPLPGITVVTPPGPLTTAAAVAISGSYSGTMTDASLAWEQNGNAVGQPIAITSFSDGSWTATIATPETAGVYRLRATFNGTGPTATSDDVTIGTSDEMNLATFTFDGSGDGADTVVVFGHSFPQGALHPTAAIVLRRTDNNAALRTQMTPLATWPDGTVRTAAFAGELPALANGTLLPVRLRRDEAHPSPGPALSWSGALAGRSIRIRTWAPGNTTTPLWTYDVGAALLNSTDDWMTGPLAITRRVAAQLPTSAVQTISGTQPGPPTVRLLVDVTATKDGMLLADWCFANDRVHVAGGGPARFGYTVEIDGVIVHDSRPASGVSRDLLQYNWWWRRRAKKGATIYNFANVFRPLFRPDYDTLVASAFLLPYDRGLWPSDWATTGFANIADEAVTNSANPYWNAGLAVNQGEAGGRPEIGYKTGPQAAWAIVPSAGRRRAELVVHLQCEAFGNAGIFFRDYEFDRPTLADEWPRFSALNRESWHPALSVRADAIRLAAGQGTANTPASGAIRPDQAHRGAHFGITALLSGRRLVYDALAFRSGEIGAAERWTGTSFGPSGAHGNFPPDHTTGVNWALPLFANQVRSTGWHLRDIVEAGYLMPDSYPRADFYRKSVLAWCNMLVGVQSQLDALYQNSFGLIISGPSWAPYRVPGYMYSFCFYGIAVAHRANLAPGLTGTILDRMGQFRAEGAASSEGMARMMLLGRDLDWAPGSQAPPFPATTWAGVESFSNPPPADWSSGVTEVDWQRNVINSTMLAAEFAGSAEGRGLAREALVRFWSERKQPNNNPVSGPGDWMGAANPQTNHLRTPSFTYEWNTPPVLEPPATMAVAAGATAGTFIGLVNWTGPILRCTTASNANHDAFEIISQPAGNPFTVTRGGRVLRSGTGTLTPGSQTLRVRARTISGSAARGETEVTRWSNTVTVTVTVMP